MTPLENIKRHESLVVAINSVLAKHGISEQINISDIIISKKTVIDCSSRRLSESITNLLWPSISSATVYHYTSRESAESIINSEVFRLTNIEKRYNEGEIITFCKTHELNGYLELDKNGEPIYRTLIMPNTFYASFADTNLSKDEEDYLWRTFAALDGVRLKIEIQASNLNFRKVYYEVKKGGAYTTSL